MDGDGAGDDISLQAPPYVARSGLRPDDTVQLIRIPTPGGAPADGGGGGEGAEPAVGSGLSPDGDASYGFSKVERDPPLLVLTVVFVVAVAVVARLRGILAMIGLGFAGAVVGWFMLPALLAGENGLLVALVGSAVIMYVVLYLAHGLSIRTSTALAGTLVGIAITTVIGLWGVESARLSGISDDTGELLLLYADGLDYQGLLTSAIIIAGSGSSTTSPSPSPPRCGSCARRRRRCRGPGCSARGCGSGATTSPRRSTRSCSSTPARRWRC